MSALIGPLLSGLEIGRFPARRSLQHPPRLPAGLTSCFLLRTGSVTNHHCRHPLDPNVGGDLTSSSTSTLSHLPTGSAAAYSGRIWVHVSASITHLYRRAKVFAGLPLVLKRSSLLRLSLSAGAARCVDCSLHIACVHTALQQRHGIWHLASNPATIPAYHQPRKYHHHHHIYTTAKSSPVIAEPTRLATCRLKPGFRWYTFSRLIH